MTFDRMCRFDKLDLYDRPQASLGYSPDMISRPDDFGVPADDPYDQIFNHQSWQSHSGGHAPPNMYGYGN
jgi:hypothetical protein